MEARLVEFAELLRQHGIQVSPAETKDAAEALLATGLDDRELVHAALKATMQKRARDEALFDRVFTLFFTGLSRVLDGIDESLLRRIEDEGVLEGDDLEMLLYTLREMGQQMSPLTAALLDGDAGAIARLLRGASLQLDFSEMGGPLQAGFFARRLVAGAGGSEARADLMEVEARLREEGLDPSKVEWVSKKLSARLREIEDAARRYVEEQAAARKASQARRKEGPPLDRSFSELSPEELERTQVAVRRLADKLKTRLVRRERQRRKGALNVRRTLRKNMAYGGVFAHLVFRHKRPQRPDVVVLCDVSDSVRNVSRLMLLFVHTLQARFSRVRSFAFVSDVGEITEAFQEVEASQAIDLAVAGKAINLYGNSNYGRALATFARDHLAGITSRTTVLIIGDGRNNYNAPHAWALRDLTRKARRVVWICPEDRGAWGFGDSEMPLYEQAVSQVVVVRNLADLEAVADELMPS